jgi:large subunit ribosomal protein L9
LKNRMFSCRSVHLIQERGYVIMEVILKQDIEKLGQKGEIKTVSPGYARNYLIPKGLVEEATPGRLKDNKMKKTAKAKKFMKEKENAQTLAKLLSEKTIIFKTKAGEGGRLFGSVTSADIAEAIAAEGIKVEKKKIQLEEPIKSLGNFQVKVRLHQEVVASVNVIVEEE